HLPRRVADTQAAGVELRILARRVHLLVAAGPLPHAAPEHRGRWHAGVGRRPRRGLVLPVERGREGRGRHPPVVAEDAEARVGDAEAAIGHQRLTAYPEVAGGQLIVGVEADDVLARRRRDAVVAGRSHALVVLMDNAHRIVKRGTYL